MGDLKRYSIRGAIVTSQLSIVDSSTMTKLKKIPHLNSENLYLLPKLIARVIFSFKIMDITVALSSFFTAYFCFFVSL